MDQGNAMNLIYPDLNKASDTMSHGKLLVKLERMRISATIMR